MAKSSGSVREWPASLLLGSGLIYMLNGLIYRPSQFSRDVLLIKSLVMHQSIGDLESDDGGDEDEDRTKPVMEERGLLFFGTIVFDRVPRASSAALKRLDSHEEIAAAYKQPTMGHVQKMFGAIVEDHNKDPAHPARGPKEKGITKDIYYLRPPRPVEHQVNFGFERMSAMASPPVHLMGQDVDCDLDEGDIHNARTFDINKEATAMWEQFPYDIMVTAPNPSIKCETYLVLSRRQRTEVDLDLLKTTDLRGVFKYIQYKVYTPDMWDALFDLYFPPKDFHWNPRWNFRIARYYSDYRSLVARLDHHQLEHVRREFKKEFDKLKWLPAAEGDRMWSTRYRYGSDWERLPRDALRGPALAINGRYWDWHACVMIGENLIEGNNEEDAFEEVIEMKEEESSDCEM